MTSSYFKIASPLQCRLHSFSSPKSRKLQFQLYITIVYTFSGSKGYLDLSLSVVMLLKQQDLIQKFLHLAHPQFSYTALTSLSSVQPSVCMISSLQYWAETFLFPLLLVKYPVCLLVPFQNSRRKGSYDVPFHILGSTCWWPSEL